MSDSEPGTPDRPSNAVISRALRDVVVAIHKTKKGEDLTVKRIRTKAEEKLGLTAGFFKTNVEWKQKSHDLILAAVEKYCGDDAPSETDPEPKPKSKPPPKKAVKPKPVAKKTEKAGVKRKPTTSAKKQPQKRRKTTVESDDESEADLVEPPTKEDTPPDVESDPPKKGLVRRGKKVVAEDSDEEEQATSRLASKIEEENDDAEVSQAQPANERETTPVADNKGQGSDSDMSDVIDESPKKKQPKKPPPKKSKSKASPVAKPKAKPSKSKVEDTPDQAEIKRLQSWLVKCGIRKVWVKELANCDTGKEKIKHLKGMLKEAGMDGKYSNEKAAAIKEQREFAKDLEAIQEGNAAWGGTGGEEGGRPRRRLARVIQKVVPKYHEEEDEEIEDNGEDETVKPPKNIQGDVSAKPKTNPKAKIAVENEDQAQEDDNDDSDGEDDFQEEDDESDDEVKFSSEDDSGGDDSE
ncbi:hypothetical protein K504DRAFT_465246 [Pleomassaria siparia CBS 279.74]|uniref:Uncharacterized protein n=1 Tax=Pleomassaria siparia CBS 279.74 TaxID=1314801 RepID=A0A6G1KGL3_9PLEO|nr:hypothetical protein K504DRAFT_465246 [Pleomassaria siparia CBS 279.74]